MGAFFIMMEKLICFRFYFICKKLGYEQLLKNRDLQGEATMNSSLVKMVEIGGLMQA